MQIDLGGGNRFAPLAIDPSGVPIIEDESVACDDSGLSVLSVMAHGHDRDPATALRVALASMRASIGLDAAVDLVL